MLLSLLIPTYNRAEALRKLFESIATESLAESDLEVVVVDDGSTDETQSVEEEYSRFLKIKYSYQQNSGRAAALQKGLAQCEGKFVMLFDSDDYFLDGGLQKIVHSLSALDVSGKVIGCCFNMIQQGDIKPPESIVASQLESNFAHVSYDLGFNKDKKEVVLTEKLQEVFPPDLRGERRLPTSYLWDCLSLDNKVIFYSDVVGVKCYSPEGMTNNIDKLRFTSPKNSFLGYRKKCEIYPNAYTSRKVYFKAYINMCRYRFLIKERNDLPELKGKLNPVLKGSFSLAGTMLAICDRFRFRDL